MSATEGDTEEFPEVWEETVDAELEGRVLAERYRIVRKLGEGGMATVYLAEHVDLGRRYAVKVLHPGFAGDPEAVERFLREARATSKIRHPNVIEITDFGRAEGTVFFVMELLTGEDLLVRIERVGRLPWSDVQAIGLQICAALKAAHAADIIHRDLKPENCFCVPGEDGGLQVKVLDFGIAKVGGLTQGAQTQLGRVFGTPAYMSPEQAEGKKVDLRTDVYSLGCTLYHALVGQPPFMGDSAMAFLMQHMYSAPQAPRAVVPQAEIPAEAEAIVLKALEKDPARRFQSMDEVAAALLAAGTGPKVVAAAAAEVMPARGARPAIGKEARKKIAVGVGALAAALLAARLLTGGASPGPEEPTPVEARPEAAIEPPPPEPSRAEVPATITLHVQASPDARVRDAASGVALGETGDPAGLILPRSEQPRELVFSAEGYEDARATVTPDRNQAINVVLKRKKRRGGGSKTGTKKTEGPSLEPLDPFGGKKKPTR